MEERNKCILVVDDDMRIRSLLEQYLTDKGFYVKAVADGQQMDRVLLRQNIDLLVLDLMLPQEDGLSICQRLRQTDNSLPIIMLTAKGEEQDRIQGLELGADDYLVKPFNPRELLARINAILKRQVHSNPAAPTSTEQRIQFGEYRFDLATRQLFFHDDQISLTSGEYAVLKALVLHAREPLSRDKLMIHARGKEYSALGRSIDVQISRLRRIIEQDPAEPRYIQTVWGLGYVFVPDGALYQ